MNSVRDLLLEELQDLYSAETQLVEGLPKMVEAAGSSELKAAFEMHLNQTREHATRLEQVFERLGERPQGESSEAMKGLLQEGQHFVEAQGEREVIDAGLIGVLQKAKHDKIAGYGTARTLARQVGEHQIAAILQQSLHEEGEADKKLTAIAESHVTQNATSR